MKRKNPYRKKVRIGIEKTREIIKYFALDLQASKTSEITGLNNKTIDDWYKYIRICISKYCEDDKQEVLKGEIELDESYFGPTRVRGKRGRGAGMKTIVFGLLKRNGKVYTEIVPDCKSDTLRQIIRGKISEESIIHTDGWRGYNGLVDIGFDKHYRVHHGENEFARGNQHINGIESFWSFTKRRFAKFNGIKREYLYYYLKESEFRFNCRLQGLNIYKELLKILKLFYS